MADISQDEYIDTLEQKTKIIASYFSDDIRRAEETQDFSNVKQRIPLILDMISVYDDLGSAYYSQTCSEFIGMLARIQKGLGMHDECRETLTALNQYQRGVENTTNNELSLNPAMY